MNASLDEYRKVYLNIESEYRKLIEFYNSIEYDSIGAPSIFRFDIWR